MRSVGVLGVPSSAGAHAPGQERAPAAFRTAGLVERLAAAGYEVHDHGDRPRVRWTPDPSNPRAQHFETVAAVASGVADVVAEVAPHDDVVLVLGGDCTIEVGVVAGFARHPERVGLVYLDAGPDLNVPSSVREGFLDWMGVAHLLGLTESTEPLRRVGPREPLLSDDDIVFLGTEPDELTAWERDVLDDRELRPITAGRVRAAPADAAAEALARLDDHVDRILVHFDVDVIDFLDFPAADFPTINAGLTLMQALECIATLTAHPKFAALTVCEFNPDHVDEAQEQVQEFVDGLVAALPAPTA